LYSLLLIFSLFCLLCFLFLFYLKFRFFVLFCLFVLSSSSSATTVLQLFFYRQYFSRQILYKFFVFVFDVIYLSFVVVVIIDISIQFNSILFFDYYLITFIISFIYIYRPSIRPLLPPSLIYRPLSSTTSTSSISINTKIT
jgi:hypothetical protein